jgi:hypothetical protein
VHTQQVGKILTLLLLFAKLDALWKTYRRHYGKPGSTLPDDRGIAAGRNPTRLVVTTHSRKHTMRAKCLEPGLSPSGWRFIFKLTGDSINSHEH